MPIKSLLVLMLLLASGLIALWRGQPETTWRELPVIAAITVSADGNLAISGSFASDCASPAHAEVRSFPHNLDIQLYRQRSSRAFCRQRAQDFVQPVAAEDKASRAYLLINGAAWGIHRDASKASYKPLELYPVHIDQASLTQSPLGELRLTLRGVQAIGCSLPELYSLRRTEGQLEIGVYNALPDDLACAAVQVDVRESLELAATELPEPALLVVNGYVITGLETQDVSKHDKVLTNIMRVEARALESYPMRVSLDVQGEHPDGCDLPVKIAQSRRGKTVTVEVYREVPADMFCPMILRPYRGDIMLDGGFESGNYTINVNSHSQTLEL